MSVNYLVEKSYKKMQLSPETIVIANEKLKKFVPNLTLYNLHKEWFNERIIGVNEKYKDFHKDYILAMENPDKNFLEWLDIRIQRPFRIPFYIHQNIINKISLESDLLFRFGRWEQELAWAFLFRKSENNLSCIIAGMIINIALKNPSKLYTKLVEYYVDKVILDVSYRDHPYHKLDVENINTMDISEIDLTWEPLWLKMGKEDFIGKLESSSYEYLNKTALLIREKAYKDDMDILMTERANFVTSGQNRIVLSKDNIDYSLKKGLFSNDLLYCELMMKNDILNNHNQSPSLLLKKHIKNIKDKHVFYTPEENIQYSDYFMSLSPNWINKENVPLWLNDKILNDMLLQDNWKNSILEQHRNVPADCFLDFVMWLTERNFLGNS
jgi:hypothetical protein